jgi:Ca-activated chloride channel family protein
MMPTFDTLTFGDPRAFWWLSVVALLGLALLLGRWLGRRRERLLGVPEVLAEVLADRSRGRGLASSLLLLTALALGVVALARPQFGMRDTEVRNTGIDTVVLLDVSKSMRVNDVAPDRLVASKLEIGRVLDRLSGGRVALIPFAGIPFVQTPFTSDFGAVRSYLDTLDARDMPVPGTNIGRALDLALRLIQGKPLTQAQGLPAPPVEQFPGSKHRAVLLFTDGENLEGDPALLADALATAGVRLFTVGVGTGFGKPVPILDEEGRQVGIQKAEDGKTPVYSALNEELLKGLAERTGGAYFHTDAGSVAEGLAGEIDKLEKQEYLERVLRLREERFQFALAPALAALALSMLLGSRRRAAR